MGKQSVSRLFFIFVVTTLLAVTAAGVVIMFVRLDSIRSQAERDAASSTARTIGPALALAASGGAPADVPSFHRGRKA